MSLKSKICYCIAVVLSAMGMCLIGLSVEYGYRKYTVQASAIAKQAAAIEELYKVLDRLEKTSERLGDTVYQMHELRLRTLPVEPVQLKPVTVVIKPVAQVRMAPATTPISVINPRTKEHAYLIAVAFDRSVRGVSCAVAPNKCLESNRVEAP